MSTHGLCLSAAASGAFRSGDKPGVYRKDFAKPGEWLVPRLGLYLSITPERMGMWAKTFQLMRDRGVSVPLTVDHIEVRDEKGNLVASEVNAAKAAARVGSVINLLANGDFEAQPADAEAEKIMLRNPEVSLELDFDFVDGHGNVYDEAITAITLTPKPVIPGQRDWVRIAASRAGASRALAIPYQTVADPKKDRHMAKMYTPEFHQKACLALNLPDETTDDAALAAKVLEVLSQHKETGEKLAAHMSRVTALETEVGTLKATNADLTGKLAAKEPIKLSRDVEGILHESVDAKLDTLVGKARITPAAAKKLATALKAGGAIMLSRDANGGTVSRANEILTALEDNDATELATLLASGSRYQRASLSRADPSDDPQPSGDVNPMLRTAQSMYPSSK